MTKKFIVIESSDVAGRHQLRASLEEIIKQKYGNRVMVIGMEYFPYDSFGSNIEECIMEGLNKSEISPYTALFANSAILSSVNDKIMQALSKDIPVICVGHLAQFTFHTLTPQLIKPFDSILKTGIFVEPCKIIHLLHDPDKWVIDNQEIVEGSPEHNYMLLAKSVNDAYINSINNMESKENISEWYFENHLNGETIMSKLMLTIEKIINTPESELNKPKKEEKRSVDKKEEKQ